MTHPTSRALQARTMLVLLAWVLPACGGTDVRLVKPTETATSPSLPARVIGGKLPPGAKLAPPEGHLAGVNCLAFSPDGRMLLSGSSDTTLLVWEVASGQVVQRLTGHRGFVRACAFVSERQVVSGGWGGEIFLWDLDAEGTKRRIGNLDTAEDVYALAMGYGGREVLVGTYYGLVRAFNLDTGKQTFASNALAAGSGPNPVGTVGYMDGGKRFAGGDNGVRVWVGEKENKGLDWDTASGVSLPDGSFVLGGNGEISVWGAQDEKQQNMPVNGHQGWVYGLAVNAKRDALLAGDSHGNAHVWRLQGIKRLCTLPKGAGLQAAAFDPSGERLAVAGDDGAVILAHAAECVNGAVLKATILRPNLGRASAIAASSTQVLVGSGTGRIAAFAPDTWRQVWSRQVHAGELRALAILPDGQWASGGMDRRVTLDGTEIDKLTSFPWALQPMPKGDALWSVDAAGILKHWTLGPKPTSKTLLDVEHPLYALAFRPGKNDAVVGGPLDELIKLEMPNGSEQARWPNELPGESTTVLGYDAAGRVLLQGSTGGDLLLRDADTGHVIQRLQSVGGTVYGIVFAGPHLWAGDSAGQLARYRYAGTDSDKPDKDINEGSPISDLALTPDQRFLIAALGDGRTAVHTLPEGELFAHLVPLADGSWATLYADGHYEASATGVARDLLLELPNRRVVQLDGDPLDLKLQNVVTIPYPDGSIEIRATVFSPLGTPKVLLDGSWEIQGLIPSPTVPQAYDLAFFLDEPSSGTHTIDVRVEGLEPASEKIRSALDPRNTRVKLIANQEYPGNPIDGAYQDAKDMRALFQDPISFGLDNDHVPPPVHDRDENQLKADIADFFSKDHSGETLIFYYAGHGQTRIEKGQATGYLVPIDYRKSGSPGVPASHLWNAIRDSNASRVLVILDACHSGAFTLPIEMMGRDLETAAKKGPLVSVLAATSAGGNTSGTATGGRFTQALIKALRLPKPDVLDPATGALTVQSAKIGAELNARELNPQAYGDLLKMILAWPKKEYTGIQTLAIPPSTAEDWLRVGAPKIVTNSYRQIDVGNPKVEGLPDKRVVTLPVHFAHDTPMVRFGIHYPDAHAPARPAGFFAGLTKGNDKTYTVPIKDVEAGRTYRLIVTPCKKAEACQEASRREIELKL